MKENQKKMRILHAERTLFRLGIKDPATFPNGCKRIREKIDKILSELPRCNVESNDFLDYQIDLASCYLQLGEAKSAVDCLKKCFPILEMKDELHESFTDEEQLQYELHDILVYGLLVQSDTYLGAISEAIDSCSMALEVIKYSYGSWKEGNEWVSNPHYAVLEQRFRRRLEYLKNEWQKQKDQKKNFEKKLSSVLKENVINLGIRASQTSSLEEVFCRISEIEKNLAASRSRDFLWLKQKIELAYFYLKIGKIREALKEFDGYRVFKQSSSENLGLIEQEFLVWIPWGRIRCYEQLNRLEEAITLCQHILSVVIPYLKSVCKKNGCNPDRYLRWETHFQDTLQRLKKRLLGQAERKEKQNGTPIKTLGEGCSVISSLKQPDVESAPLNRSAVLSPAERAGALIKNLKLYCANFTVTDTIRESLITALTFIDTIEKAFPGVRTFLYGGAVRDFLQRKSEVSDLDLVGFGIADTNVLKDFFNKMGYNRVSSIRLDSPVGPIDLCTVSILISNGAGMQKIQIRCCPEKIKPGMEFFVLESDRTKNLDTRPNAFFINGLGNIDEPDDKETMIKLLFDQPGSISMIPKPHLISFEAKDSRKMDPDALAYASLEQDFKRVIRVAIQSQGERRKLDPALRRIMYDVEKVSRIFYPKTGECDCPRQAQLLAEVYKELTKKYKEIKLWRRYRLWQPKVGAPPYDTKQEAKNIEAEVRDHVRIILRSLLAFGLPDRMLMTNAGRDDFTVLRPMELEKMWCGNFLVEEITRQQMNAFPLRNDKSLFYQHMQLLTLFCAFERYQHTPPSERTDAFILANSQKWVSPILGKWVIGEDCCEKLRCLLNQQQASRFFSASDHHSKPTIRASQSPISMVSSN